MSKKTKLFSAKNEKIIIGTISAVLIAIVFFSIGNWVGNGRLVFGNGRLFSINTNSPQGLPNSLNYSAIQQEYNILKLNFDGKLTPQQLQDGLMSGLTTATGDPFTEYFNTSQANNFNNQLNNTFTGIGAVLGADSKGEPEIMSPLKGYPADKAGLMAKDVIVSINGKPTAGESVDTAVNSIRGQSGSTVTLLINRNGQPMTFKIVRQKITSPSVQSSIINGNIGYLQITSFSNDTASLAQNAANDFKSKGVKSVILDLRDNPGGLVDSAVSVSSLWLPSGKTIMIQKHNNQVVQTYQSNGNDILNGIPTVVLINGGSASASEITAAALHDNKAAKLLGEKSYGKGTEQQIIQMPGGAEIKVTIAHWYTPNNISIHHVGVTPDTKVTQSSSDTVSGADTQKNAAINYLQNL